MWGAFLVRPLIDKLRKVFGGPILVLPLLHLLHCVVGDTLDHRKLEWFW